MDCGMPKNDWLPLFVRSIFFFLVSMQIECPDGSVLIAFTDWKLLGVLRERLYKVIPVLQMIRIWVVGIEPGKIGEFSSLM
jgi:hypothetical protein